MKVDYSYAKHWDAFYNRDDQHIEGRLVAKEWHCCFENLHSFIPYLDKLVQQSPSTSVLDIGCGSSNLSQEMARAYPQLTPLYLIDIAPDLIQQRAEDARQAKLDGNGPTYDLHYLTADCRDMKDQFTDGQFGLVLDKGTLDALHSIEERRAMFREIVRVLRSDGLFLSIAFSDPSRLKFLDAESKSHSIQCHHYIIAKGDPLVGFGAKFLSVLSRKAFTENDYKPDELTVRLIKRLETTGSLYDDQVNGLDDLGEFFC